tara:strand:+ start:1131 stop:1244 length:114 start_codon:yes stop_codon:yes gene_type:complete
MNKINILMRMLFSAFIIVKYKQEKGSYREHFSLQNHS